VKNDIVFFNSMPGVATAYPIVKSGEIDFKWVDKVRASYKHYIQNPQFNEKTNVNKHTHIRRCPGIFEILEAGYIVRLPYDINVYADRSNQELHHTLPQPAFAQVLDVSSIVHPNHGIPGIEKLNIKIATGWEVLSPVKFLIIPIPYPDGTPPIESSIGILDPSFSSEINLQGWWNAEGEVLLPAGMPLMQLIPLTERNMNLICREATVSDIRWVNTKKYLQQHTFSSPTAKKVIQKVYQHFCL